MDSISVFIILFYFILKLVVYSPHDGKIHTCKYLAYPQMFHWDGPFSYCTGPFKEMHQEFQQITGPSVFDQQIFRRGLLQRNNFPLHFLSWTKTPLKWMAFAHSLWPQLAVLLPTLVLWPQNRQTGDEGQ